MTVTEFITKLRQLNTGDRRNLKNVARMQPKQIELLLRNAATPANVEFMLMVKYTNELFRALLIDEWDEDDLLNEVTPGVGTNAKAT